MNASRANTRAKMTRNKNRKLNPKKNAPNPVAAGDGFSISTELPSSSWMLSFSSRSSMTMSIASLLESSVPSTCTCTEDGASLSYDVSL